MKLSLIVYRSLRHRYIFRIQNTISLIQCNFLPKRIELIFSFYALGRYTPQRDNPFNKNIVSRSENASLTIYYIRCVRYLFCYSSQIISFC